MSIPLEAVRIHRRTPCTIEVFPPANPDGIEGLSSSVRRLSALAPEFVSVTYGAGGSTRERSLAVVKRLHAETRGRVAAHVTCVACTADETDSVVDQFQSMGVRRFFALRGDVPGEGVTAGSYPDAASLVRALSARGIEDIYVAAYPEVHPKARSADADIAVLKSKFDAGARCAVTQFFLDNSSYYRFRDRLRSDGLEGRLVPGLLLFEDFGRAANFAGRCGTSVPDGLRRRFDRFADNREGARAEALEFLSEQIEDLRAHGVERFHLYALNRADTALALFGAEALAAPITAAA